MIEAKITGNLLKNPELGQSINKDTGEVKDFITFRVMSNQHKKTTDQNTGETKKEVDQDKSTVVYGILSVDPNSYQAKQYLEQLKQGMRVEMSGWGLLPFLQTDQNQIKANLKMNVEKVLIVPSDRIEVHYKKRVDGDHPQNSGDQEADDPTVSVSEGDTSFAE